MPLYQFGKLTPQVANNVWVAPSADVIGQVRLDAEASVWFGTVIRADNALVHIGAGSSVQDNCTIHVDVDGPVIIEPNVSIGHQAMLHACHIGEGSLIGMQAILLSGCRIGRNCLVAAGALVTERKEFPDGVLIMGAPAKVVRQLTPEEIAGIHEGTRWYVEKAQHYAEQLQEIQPQL
jgi:carbonic anhydrase/acetyltransferase-like protein (isoleucine patch superfamily)